MRCGDGGIDTAVAQGGRGGRRGAARVGSVCRVAAAEARACLLRLGVDLGAPPPASRRRAHPASTGVVSAIGFAAPDLNPARAVHARSGPGRRREVTGSCIAIRYLPRTYQPATLHASLTKSRAMAGSSSSSLRLMSAIMISPCPALACSCSAHGTPTACNSSANSRGERTGTVPSSTACKMVVGGHELAASTAAGLSRGPVLCSRSSRVGLAWVAVWGERTYGQHEG